MVLPLYATLERMDWSLVDASRDRAEQCTSVVALIVRARFVGTGRTLEEASFDLGAGPVATFVQVTLPRLAPAIVAGGLLAFTLTAAVVAYAIPRRSSGAARTRR